MAELTLAELHLVVPDKLRELEKGVVTIKGSIMTVDVRYDAFYGGLTYAGKFKQQSQVSSRQWRRGKDLQR